MSGFRTPPNKRRLLHRRGSRRALGFDDSPRTPRSQRVTLDGVKSPEQEAYLGRFIPSRSEGDLSSQYDLAAITRRAAQSPRTPQRSSSSTNANANSASKEKENSFSSLTYSSVLRSELVSTGNNGPPTSLPMQTAPGSPVVQVKTPNILRFKVRPRVSFGAPPSPYSLSPMGEHGKRLLVSPQKAPRKIAKAPFKVLEAPAIQDDFYLNLVDWSSQNVLSVGLSNCVYLWNAQTSNVTKLVDLGSDLVTSVSWMQRGPFIAVGSNTGVVQVWDAVACKLIRTLEGHKSRVGTLSWNGNVLSSGSRDRVILERDLRESTTKPRRLVGHKQEVCGLRWSWSGQHLASGGNDNRLLIWDSRNNSALMRYQDHTAAVKAIAWSPHQRGLLASGGGTADRNIKFRNVLASTGVLHSIDTGSQVCNLAWSKNVNELVSTHGYSQNQIVVWTYPGVVPLATLTGHTMRVLYLAVSPDGQTIVTGAGDETLRFWNVFPGAKRGKEAVKKVGMGVCNIIR